MAASPPTGGGMISPPPLLVPGLGGLYGGTCLSLAALKYEFSTKTNRSFGVLQSCNGFREAVFFRNKQSESDRFVTIRGDVWVVLTDANET